MRRGFPFILLLALGCGGAPADQPRAANDVEEPPVEEPPAEETPVEETPVADAEPVAESETAEEVPVASARDHEDDLGALEGADLTDTEPTPTPAPRRRRGERGIASGNASAPLVSRRAGVHIGPRRAPRVRPPQTLDDETVDRVIDEHIGEVRFCYSRAFGNRPDVHGRVTVRATIAPDGQVAEAHVDHSTIRSSQVDRCIIDAFRRWRFPPAESETSIEHPFRLGPQ